MAEDSRREHTAPPAPSYASYNYYAALERLSQEESTLLYYLNVIRRRLWTVLAVFVVVATIGSVNAYRQPNVYQAVAKVLVERQTPRVMRFDGLSQDVGWDPEYYSTQAEIIRSRAVLEKALEQKEISAIFQLSATAPAARQTSVLEETRRTIVALLGAMPAPPPEAWEMLRGQINVNVMRDTHFFLIKSEGTDPRRATTLVNAVASAYEQYNVERKVESYGEAFLFLDREKKKQEQLLAQAEKEMQEFRQSAREVTLSGNEQDQPALRRLKELSEKLTQVQLDRIEFTAQMGVVRDALNSSTNMIQEGNDRLLSLTAVRSDPAVADVQRQLAETKREIDRLSATYGPEHPLLKETRGNAALLEKQFRDALAQLVLSLNGRLTALQNQEEELLKEEESQKLHAVDLAKEVFAFNKLQNSLASHRKLYEALVDRMREVDVSSGYIKTNVQIMEKAGVPVAPVRPQRGRTVILSMLLGLVLGAALGFVFENLDDTIKTPEDLKKRIDIPLLGFVPRMKRKGGGEGPERSYRVTGLVSLKEPVSSVAEAYRNIRTSLLFSIPAGDTNILGITSANPSEGKTTTACNLAVVTALSGKNVLLIDGDIHRPMVNRVFSIKGDVGLTNILIGECETLKAIQPFRFKSPVSGRLDVIPAGPESPNPAELIGSQKMKDLLAEVKTEYDWVFVDIPPVLFISDAGILSALCEGVILVVRSAVNNKSILMKTKERLDELKAKVVGSVLNDVVVSRLGRYYSDYAYYGYSKYSSKYHKSYYSREEKGKGRKSPAAAKASSEKKVGDQGAEAGDRQPGNPAT